MLESTKAFSSFSVDDIPKAKHFYRNVLGLKVEEESMPGMTMLKIFLRDEQYVLVYQKDDHVPATFTIINFPVQNLSAEVKALREKGIEFEKYETTDEEGINHNEGPLISWFKDPAGNFLSLMESADAPVEDGFTIKKFLPLEVSEAFTYFTSSKLLEKWAAPEGMTLNLSLFEAKEDGDYRYEHSNKKGVYVCVGYFKEFIPNKKIVQIDEAVQDPSGKVIYQNLRCVVEFAENSRGTEITLTQSGFADDEDLENCQKGWNQCLDKLLRLISPESNLKQNQNSNLMRTNY